jgi:hypothetical protein
VGACRYEAFQRRTPTLHLLDPKQRDQDIARWLLVQGGACDPLAWQAAGWGNLPPWVRKVPKDSIAATPEAAALFAANPTLAWAVCAPRRALDAAVRAAPIPWF